MFVPGDPRFDEMILLAGRATGTGLHDKDRGRWRELCGQLLGELNAQGSEATDRRRALRAAARIEVRLLAPEALSGLFTSSVGAGGLSMIMPLPPPVGTDLELSIALEGREEPIFARGQVAYVLPMLGDNLVGVAFTNLVQNQRELLEGLAVRALLARIAAQ
ncbi:MAG: hypothetical protein NVSMB23_09870 [Myxococcales bacterium]